MTTVKPRLLLLSYSKLDSDPRVLKQLELFRDDFFVVTCGYGAPPPGVTEHHRIPDDAPYWRRSRIATILRQFTRAYWSSPASQWVRNNLGDAEFDAILANDIDSVGAAHNLKSKGGVHADLHEYSPLEKEDVLTWRLFVAPYVRWQMRKFVKKAVSTTTSATHFVEEYQRVWSLDPALVINATPYYDLRPGPVGDSLRLVHSGAGKKDRQIEVMIRAFARSGLDASFDLYLTENEPDYLESLRQLASETPGVRIMKPVDYDRLIETLNGYDVGVHFLAPTNFNNYWALPNKIFDFIQARLAVVMSPNPELKRVVDDTGIGVVFGEFTEESLAEALAALTPADVAAYKAIADSKAHQLSSENAVKPWRAAILAMVGRSDG